MKAPAPADVARWSEEVARDPSALSFLPLARAFRKQGRRDAALKLVLRGLEHHPTHVEAHALLAMLYFESGQRSKAYDEWSMVLTLEPENFEALRGMGFYHLELGDDTTALRSLQRASALRPADVTVQEALKLIHEKTQAARAEVQQAPSDLMPWEEPDPWSAQPASAPPAARMPTVPEPRPAFTPISSHPPAPTYMPPPPQPASTYVAMPQPAYVPPPQSAPPAQPTVQHAPPPPPPVRYDQPAPATAAASQAPPISDDPARLFDPVLRGGQVLGALLLDAQGLVLAGSLSGETGSRAEALGAILGGAIEEAARTTAHLALGSWKGILLESEQALLHLAPVRDGTILLLAAKRETPAGWMLRSASQASTLAARFLEVYA